MRFTLVQVLEQKKETSNLNRGHGGGGGGWWGELALSFLKNRY